MVVGAMEKAPRRLHVTWRDPPSWGSTFYRLQFQLRYRAENSHTYSEVLLPHGITSYTISDALRGLRHFVKVRAREEFDHGSWSEWSREITGVPWTEPTDPVSDPTSDVTKFSFDDYFVGTSSPRTSEVPRRVIKPAAAVPLYSFLIMALSVTVALALAVGILFRYRKKLRLLHSRGGKPSSAPSYSLATLGPEPPLSAFPLLSPPASPFSETSADSPSVLDQNSPYDVSNADYFLLPK
uniref:Fibronectin type-III domain-containing protein n=2 Tax=Varanus komodoensis TaxID=61221 RepID=A0A8D2L0Y1_VARKO